MACTIEKILTDAKTLLDRLKDHDNAAESLIDQSTMLHKKVVAMKEAGTTLSHKVSADLLMAQIDWLCRLMDAIVYTSSLAHRKHFSFTSIKKMQLS